MILKRCSGGTALWAAGIMQKPEWLLSLSLMIASKYKGSHDSVLRYVGQNIVLLLPPKLVSVEGRRLRVQHPGCVQH